MKKWMLLITVVVLLSVNGLADAASTATSAPAMASTDASFLATVQIEHSWDYRQGSHVYHIIYPSLGTVIGPNLILTHNHYTEAPATAMNETMAFRDSRGVVVEFRIAELQGMRIDGGTTLIRLPRAVSMVSAPVMNQVTLHRLSVGDWLTMNYWDDAASRPAQRQFQIVQIANGVAQLADPDRLINSGDSGGGAFFDGQLVGNTWSINADQIGQSLGIVNVALLPAQVFNLVQ